MFSLLHGRLSEVEINNNEGVEAEGLHAKLRDRAQYLAAQHNQPYSANTKQLLAAKVKDNRTVSPK